MTLAVIIFINWHASLMSLLSGCHTRSIADGCFPDEYLILVA